MWIKRIALVAVIPALASILFSQATQQVTLPDLGESGNNYLHSCEALTHNEDFSVQDVQCGTYTQGVVEGLTAYQVQSRSALFNAPSPINVSHVEKIVVKYMNDRPKNLDVATSQIILWSLMDAYPSPKK